MISPTPTQSQPPHEAEAEQERTLTPLRPRPGQTPAARMVKAFFRPILKAFYYLFRAMGTHKGLTVGVIILLLLSIGATSYFSTGELPYGIGKDQFNFNVRGTNGGGDIVRNWLYALRDGNTVALSLLDKNISQPPDPAQLVSQFSQTQGHLTWKSITVMSAYGQADGTVDSFVEVNLSANGPGGAANGLVIWHFTTLNQGKEYLLKANMVDFRSPLQ